MNFDNIEQFFEGVDLTQLDVIKSILDKACSEESGEHVAVQIREIVPVDKWLNYTYFLGPFAKDIYPYWKEQLPIYLNSGKPELIVTGGIGTGKSFNALIACIRKIYELSCYDNPQRLFGLSDATDIFFAYLSINITHAERTGFGQLRTMIDAIPYFQKEFPRNKALSSVIKFPKRICVIPGSDNLSVISTNLYGCMMDEADFYRKGNKIDVGDAQKASKIYKEVTDRRISRFLVKGLDYGFSAIVSSASYQSSFTSSRIAKAKRENSATVLSSVLWDVKPDNYSSKRFFVFKGTEKHDAFIINGVTDVANVATDNLKPAISALSISSGIEGNDLISYLMTSLPKAFTNNFVAIPVDLRKSFDDDIYSALRNFAGCATSPTGRLFTSIPVWNKTTLPELRHPFTKDIVTVSVKGQEHLIDYFIKEALFERNEDGKFYGLRRHPSAKRYAHLDYSETKDRTGCAIVHTAGWKEDPDTYLLEPIIETDLVLAIHAPKKPDKISFAKIRKFFFDLITMGMNFGMISFDQFQSEDTIQIFTSRGIKAKKVSFGKSDAPFIQAVELMYEDRLLHYNYPTHKGEFFNLVHDPERHTVDHLSVLEDGSPGYKDVSDSWVCAVDSCINGGDLANKDRQSNIRDMTTNSDKLKVSEPMEDSWAYSNYSSPDGRNITGIIGDGSEGIISIF